MINPVSPLYLDKPLRIKNVGGKTQSRLTGRLSSCCVKAALQVAQKDRSPDCFSFEIGILQDVSLNQAI